MNLPGPSKNPYESPTLGKHEPPLQPASHLANLPLALVASLAMMLPWPLLALGLCQAGSLLDHFWEISLLVGSVTMLFLLPIMLVAEPPEWLLSALVTGVWVLVLVAPPVVVTRRRHTKAGLVVMFLAQAAFSALQAGLGVLMIVGKSV